MDILKTLLKKASFEIEPKIPFGTLEIEFLDKLSKNLISNKKARKYPDVIAFAFWCRKKNLVEIKNNLHNGELRIGLGSIFHITPSNVPLNFAYSFAFGLLTGNSNLVKLPSTDFKQTLLVCLSIKNLFREKKFRLLGKENFFFKYNSDEKEITKEISLRVDGRIVWGGDKTVNDVKTFLTKPRSKDIFFADRYSFCLIKSSEINKCNSNKIKDIANKFYNDTYFMDQNACSSPRMIIWYGSEKQTKVAKNKFWPILYEIVKRKYSLEKTNVIQKFTDLCEFDIKNNRNTNFHNYENLVYRVEILDSNSKLKEFKNKFGYFYEFNFKNLDEIKKMITQKFQTLAYFGIKKNKLKNFIIKNKLKGIDRIVPLGCSHNIGFLWDGYNIDKQLARMIDIQ